MGKKYLFFFLFCAVCNVASMAQYKNIYLDTGADGQNPTEPSIAINRLDPDNIVAGAVLNKIYFTLDGGATWSTSELESTFGVYGDPVIVSDKKGVFHYFHLSDPTGKNWESDEFLDRIVVQSSEDGGESWSDRGYFGLNPPKDQDKEGVTVHPFSNDLIATWTQFDKYGSEEASDKSNIFISVSSNSGKKWSKPVRLNFLSGDCLDGDKTTMGATPAVGYGGQLFACWAFDEKIYFDRSFDEGKTWLGNDINIADQPGGWSMEITDIWFIRSNSNGDRWNRPDRVNDDEPGKHQFFPAMTVDQITGYIYILYYDRRNYEDNQTDVYISYSENGGESFSSTKISEQSFIPDKETFLGDYIAISAHQAKIAAVWTRMDNKKTSIVMSVFDQKELGLPELVMPDFGKKRKKKKKEKKDKDGSEEEENEGSD